MTNVEIIVSGGETSDSGEFIFDRLPPWMPIDEGSGNFKLLDAVGRSIDRLDGDITEVDHASTVQEAESVEELEQLAKLVNLPRKDGESLEKYRIRIIAEYQTLTGEGTAADVIENAATILNTDTSKIKYTDLSENGAIQLAVPSKALSNLSISNSEFVSMMEKHGAAGFRIDATLRGTFTYNSPGDSHDAANGYDGLDTNDNPKDNGGTYAGLL